MTVVVRDCFGAFPHLTRGLPEPDWIADWRKELRHLMRLDVVAPPEVSFHADPATRMVLLVRTGASVLLRRSCATAVGSGDAVSSRVNAGSFIFSPRTGSLALNLSGVPLKSLLCDVDAADLGPVPRNDSIRLLENYLAVLADEQPLACGELRRTVLAHLCDLAAVVVAATPGAARQPGPRGLRSARLCAIKADIAEGLRRGGEVSVGKLAARHQVTARYVQMLFEGEGTTFTRFVLGERLARVHRMLTNPGLPDRGIASVAFDAGFGDLSYFIRAFRRAYGAKPSEVRDRAARNLKSCAPDAGFRVLEL